jgi:signal transduction histidine kinase
MRNLRTHFNDEEYTAIGRSYMHSPGLRFGFLVARMLYGPMDFYRWMNKPREGLGNQMFTCVHPTHREPGPNEIEMDLTVPEGFEVCWDFFLVSRGNMEELPRLLGLPRSEVTLTRIERGGRFHIKVPHRVPFLRRIGRFIARPFMVNAAGRELKAAHEDLLERYEELNVAKTKLAEYQVGLEKMVDERTRELREARDQLSVTVEQLHEAQNAREKFFGNISHEIRTPLSLILLAGADIEARAGKHMDERARRSLGSISDGARKLVRLVDELLLLAAGQAEKLKVHPEPTDLAQLVDNAIVAWRPAAEAAGLALAYDKHATLYASLDPVAIERVVSNLISNAIKYTPRGGSVTVELAKDADGIRISVLDTGPGIDPELAGRLFGRFERAAGEDRRKAGTGIGLALVRELTQAHEGDVAAHPRKTGGTEMRVTLPASRILKDGKKPLAARSRMADLAPAVASSATIASGSRFTPPGLSGGTILLAEDDPQLAEMIARLLGHDYTVVVGLDGVAAADLIAANQPHLLVTDVDMPGMNGIELAKVFREKTGDKLAPIIILSAVLDLGTRVAGLEAGAVDYVTKPFDPEELRARVRAQFRMREMAMRLHRAEQLSSMGILVSGLAHEIRNPANGIANAVAPLASLLPAELRKPDGGVAQLLDVMKQCASQITSMSKQLLSFRNGGDGLDMKPAQIPDIVDRAIVLAQGSLDGIELRKRVAIEGDVICASPLLVQVLTNLIENAAHAVGPGGWIEVQGHAEGGRITVEVADSGAGVPLEMRERVFEPFFTTKDPGKGTGLGLSVARAIVTRHGGVLEIRDRGARPAFVMEIPQKVVGGPRKAV